MQIVGYQTATANDPAALLLSDGGIVEEHPLVPDGEVTFALGDRHCAGVLDDGIHLDCANDGAPYCPTHTSRWPCARCDGTCAMPTMACHEEHAVYLAAFAPDTIKVGVTRSWRLETRLREQGADRGAHIRTVKNGRVARQLETDMAERYPDRVRVATKIETLHQAVDDDVWATVVDDHDPIETFDLEYGLSLAAQPVPETIASGTVRGTQGRVLVIDRAGTTYAVDLRDLVGYEVTGERPSRNLQASFGAFE